MHLEPSAGSTRHRLIDIDRLQVSGLRQHFIKRLRGPLEKALAIDACNILYADFASRLPGCGCQRDVFQAALDALGVRLPRDVAGRGQIPAEGPLVAVANHPFGGPEGVVLAALLLDVRPDVKVLGNYLLKRLAGIGESIIAVDPFGSQTARAGNRRALRAAIDWLETGGALVVFPSGEVSSPQWRQGHIADPPWSPHVGAIIRRTAATALPVYFPGRNGWRFHLAGLVHPRLRTCLLPGELVRRAGQKIQVCLGRPIPWAKLRRLPDDRCRTGFLRASTYLLQNRKKPGPRLGTAQAPIAVPLPNSRVAGEIAELGPTYRLAAGGEFAVYLARADQIPHLLHEIGRQREISFRCVQEGTGAAIDLDVFDRHYLHLFLWNHRRRELAGAYRLGLTDQILQAMGPEGLYSHQLFRYKPSFLAHLGQSIELGRSFIRPEYQRQFSCLSLLWRGIGEFIARCPSYRLLFGPVSISQAYAEVSRRLLVQFLTARKFAPDLADMVRPRCPYRAGAIAGLPKSDLHATFQDIDDVSLLISTLEEDAKGVPVLLRQYLKLNGRLISFNVDKAFSRVVDGLFLVDLRHTDPRLLTRFMGPEGAARFTGFHRLTLHRCDQAAACAPPAAGGPGIAA
jgi:putative hemolysin